MESTRTNTPCFSKMTKNRISSAKGLLMLSAILAFILDAATLVVLACNTSELKFSICPILLVVLDITLIFKIIFSNYRFSYAIKDVLLHVVGILLVCAYMLVSSEILDGRIIFTTLALYAMPAVHLILALTAIVNAFHAANKRYFIAIAMTGIFTFGALAYGFFLSQYGFFGQTCKRTERTLVYDYDESKGYYVVTDILKGFGNTVTVPETFNGAPVGGINCEIFANENISYVVFDCSPEIEILNVQKLNRSNKDLTFETKKSQLDDFREKMFSLAMENAEFLSLANSITPYDLGEDQVFVVFCYDRSALNTAGGDILPTWFGNVRDVFDVRSHAPNVRYIDHSDNEDITDLYWCTKNQNGMIFHSVCDEDGTALNNVTVTDSLRLNVTFEKIYQIHIGEDNDTVFSLDQTQTGINTEDGIKPYKLATADRVMTVLEQLPVRAGFDRSFKIGFDKHDLTDIAYEIAALDQAGMSQINVFPHWQLRVPTITKIEADGKTQGHSAVYGSDVKLTSEAKAPDASISLKYEWKKTNVLAQTSDCSINNIQPSDAGEYTLTVTAYSENSSLTSTAVKTVSVGFTKKELHYTWILPVDKVYSASDKELSVTPWQGDVINNDVITQDLVKEYTYNLQTQQVTRVLNAGDYRVSVVLTGDASKKYEVVASDVSREFTVSPYPVYVQWENVNQFEYDGFVKGPAATVRGLGSDGNLQIFVDGKETNAGDYVAKASTANTNYTLLETEKAYTITKKPISALTWQGQSSFVYDSTVHHPKVEGITGITTADKSKVLESLVYSGAQVNAGTGYTVSVQLAETLPSSNYVLECDTTKAYSITPKPMTLTITSLSAEYTGTVIESARYSFTTGDVAKNDQINEIVSLAYRTYLNGVETDAVNVNALRYTVGGDKVPGVKYGNYDITVVSGTLEITPKEMTVTLKDQQKVYNGKPFEGEYTYNHTGLISAYDTFGEVIRALSFAEISAKDVGDYDIRAQVHASDMGVKYGNYKITVVPATLTITKAPLTVTAVGATKVYDGYTFRSDDFNIAVIGTLYEEKTPADLGTAVFSGKAYTEKNVGTYTLSVTLIANALNKNYDITYVDGDATITPKPVTVTVKDTSKTYNGQTGGSFDFEITSDQLGYGDTKSSLGKITYGGPAAVAKDAGTYSITVTDIESGNYIIGSVNEGTFTIHKKSITVTPSAIARTYDATSGGAFNVTASGLVSGENVSVLGTPSFYGDATTAINAGQYTLSVAFPSEPKNYVITQYNTVGFIIKKAKFTVNVTTKSKEYDGKPVDINALQYTVSGLFGNDTVQMLGTPRYSGSLVTNNFGNAGNYQLILVLPGNENYEEGSVVTDYTITPKNVTVTAVASDKIYDGTAGGNFSITVDGLIAGENASALGVPTFYGDAATAKNAGEYVLKVNFNGSTGNYAVTKYVDAAFRITPKSVTVTAVAPDKIYDGAAGGNFSITVDGLIAGENASALGAPTFYGDAAAATNVGTYTLKVRFDGATGNYAVTQYVDTAFRITPKEVTVTAVAPDRAYEEGKTGGDFTFRMDGLVSGSESDFVPAFNGSAVGATQKGTYVLKVEITSGNNFNNYVFNYVDAEFTIS